MLEIIGKEKRLMKSKIFKGLILVSSIFSLNSCQITDDQIIIYNWADYIDLGIDDDGYIIGDSVTKLFENYYKEQTGRSIKVLYQTFSTNEDLYNGIKIGQINADLVCPSDYMIQKMAKENMLENFSYDEKTNSYSELKNYNSYGSPYIKDLFKRNGFSSYAIPYTWGTMGFTYNTEYVNDEDVSSWDALYSAKLSKKITVKDSVRDTYFTVVMHLYKTELDELKNDYESNKIDLNTYTEKLTEIFNRVDDDTLSKAEEALAELKKNIYGLEVDDGKNDIVTGKYYASLSWSGDAVYSMDQGDEGDNPVELKYIVPEEGSNIWFDGWCMPKGANMKIAQMFVDFLSRPDIAAKNMEFTGYTSSIAGEDILNLVKDWYEVDESEAIKKVDLSYFFNGTLEDGESAIINVGDDNRQFDAQYPSEEVINRCAIMKDFGSQTDKLNQIWSNFKARF
mgnify:FL=1